ncbi:hypothetical protein PROFUN_08840 [Planoprotostelium fungivorum]|uniref:Uncharacterized protein n=1 Tax=Planoprotostelium fungivorum TaxID=1890364 RepID=A0A2P6NIW1_9EUKA|nr:hypothetical protein PROFUN_08840 [Planoprotostelium fungivorum]
MNEESEPSMKMNSHETDDTSIGTSTILNNFAEVVGTCLSDVFQIYEWVSESSRILLTFTSSRATENDENHHLHLLREELQRARKTGEDLEKEIEERFHSIQQYFTMITHM